MLRDLTCKRLPSQDHATEVSALGVPDGPEKEGALLDGDGDADNNGTTERVV